MIEFITVSLKAKREFDLTGCQTMLCAYILFRQCDPGGNSNGWCTDAITNTARAIGFDRKTVERAKIKLIEMGLIEAKKAEPFGFRVTSKYYDVAMKEWGKTPHTQKEGGAKRPMGMGQNAPQDGAKRPMGMGQNAPTRINNRINNNFVEEKKEQQHFFSDSNKKENSSPQVAAPPPQFALHEATIEWLRAMCLDELLMEQVCYNAFPPAYYITAVDEFRKHLIVSREDHTSEKELRHHFRNWARKPQVISEIKAKGSQVAQKAPQPNKTQNEGYDSERKKRAEAEANERLLKIAEICPGVDELDFQDDKILNRLRSLLTKADIIFAPRTDIAEIDDRVVQFAYEFARMELEREHQNLQFSDRFKAKALKKRIDENDYQDEQDRMAQQLHYITNLSLSNTQK